MEGSRPEIVPDKDAVVRSRHIMLIIYSHITQSHTELQIEMLCERYIRKPRKKQQLPPKRSEADKKLLDRAKGLLMERNGMSEPEAFRYIQKNSMDYGRKITESAQMILT